MNINFENEYLDTIYKKKKKKKLKWKQKILKPVRCEKIKKKI